MKCTLIILVIFSALKIWAQSEEPQQILIIDSIACQGNTQTNCEFIKKEFYQNPSEVLNEEEIQNAKIRLKLKNLFESVDVFLQKGAQKYHVVVTFDVVEKDPTFTETTINSSADYPFKSTSDLKFTFGNRNLFGNGETLTGTVGYLSFGDSENQNATGKIEYTDPHFLDSKSYFFNTSIEHRRNLKTSEIPEDGAVAVYPEMLTTYTLGGGKRIFDFSYISLKLSHSDANIKTQSNSETFSRSETTNRFDLSYGWNTENDTYFATTGDRLNINYDKTLYNQNFLSNSESNSQESYQATYSRRFLISNENSIRLAGTGYTSVYKDLYRDSKLNFFNPTFEFNHQLVDTPLNKNNLIQKAKVYFNLSPIYTFASDNAVSYQQQEFGVLMDSKKLGIIKLFLTHWSLQ